MRKPVTSFFIVFFALCSLFSPAAQELYDEVPQLEAGSDSAGTVQNAAADGSPEGGAVLLTDGKTEKGLIKTGPQDQRYASYAFDVDDSVWAVKISVSSLNADMDLFVEFGRQLTDYESAGIKSETSFYNETLVVSRLSSPALKTGRYYVDAAYLGAPLPGQTSYAAAEYSITVKFIKTAPALELAPDREETIVLDEAGMYHRLIKVRVPAASALKGFYIRQDKADADFTVGLEARAAAYNQAEIKAATVLKNEYIRFTPSEAAKFAGKDVYITVFLPGFKGGAVNVKIYADTLNRLPPGFSAVELPRVSGDILSNAFFSTVEIKTGRSRASGVLISRKGLIVTSLHALKKADGSYSDTVTAGLTFSPEEAARELFTAKLIMKDEKLDLALLRISGNLYGQPLPAGIVFPYFTLDAGAQKPGRAANILSYPDNSDFGTSEYITLTRGIVSGFTEKEGVLYLRTDAQTDAGSSGGAFCNNFYELAGIAGFYVGNSRTRQTYIIPVSAFPAAWLDEAAKDNR
jgi:S1-C subfamily serine protease